MRSPLLAAACLALMACETANPAVASKRASLSRQGGTTFQILPGDAQQPYCLAYTVSRSGLTRQLTMSRSNQSFECAPGKPVGNRSFKVPLNEGPVKVFVFFTSQPVNAASVSQQILDAVDRQSLSIMNMRLPGKASLETLEFSPEEDVAPEVGGIVEPDAGTPAVDAGTP